MLHIEYERGGREEGSEVSGIPGYKKVGHIQSSRDLTENKLESNKCGGGM